MHGARLAQMSADNTTRARLWLRVHCSRACRLLVVIYIAAGCCYRYAQKFYYFASKSDYTRATPVWKLVWKTAMLGARASSGGCCRLAEYPEGRECDNVTATYVAASRRQRV